MKNINFDWNDLKFFLATARQQGLTGAAALLGTSPSTVSRHLAALEERLGTTLFLRQQTGYLLTDDGSALLMQAEQVEQAIMDAEHSGLATQGQELSGQVRLATTEMLALHLIVPNLQKFRARYPGLRVELSMSLTRANLSKREADLALRITDPTLEDGAGDYIANRAGSMDFAAYCAAGMVDPQHAGKGPEAWSTLDFVSWDESWSDLPMAKWLKAAFHGKPPALACNSLQAQHVALRSGLGVGVLPCFVGDRDPSLQRLGPRQALISRDLWLVVHRDLKASRRVLALRDFIQSLLQSHLS